MTVTSTPNDGGNGPDLPGRLPWEDLRPFMSLLVLQAAGDDVDAGFTALEQFLLPGMHRRGVDSRLIARSAWVPGEEISPELAEALTAAGVDRMAGFAVEENRAAGWLCSDSVLLSDCVGAEFPLAVLLRVGRFAVLHACRSDMERLKSWLRQPLCRWRRIPANVLENALLQGEIKGLWLYGVDRPRRNKADSKIISGISLGEALDPVADATYALGSGRAALADDPDRIALKGKIGTTPRNSRVWSSRRLEFADFVQAVGELVRMIEKQMANGSTGSSVLSRLAQPVADTTGIYGAFEMVPALDEPPDAAEPDRGNAAAAAALEYAAFVVIGRPDTVDFIVETGVDGTIGGSLTVSPRQEGDRYTLAVGYVPGVQPIREDLVIPVKNALHNSGLVRVYYRSGHMFFDGNFYKHEIPDVHFPKWEWGDFDGYLIDREKPDTRKRQEIHDRIGQGDRSLFTWVSRNFADGWLTCDDGSREAADFIHIDNNGRLRLIHIKGAENASPRRGIAVTPYEVVVSQALKNLIYTDVERLRRHLEHPGVERPATWNNGVRADDRSELLDMLDSRRPTDGFEIVIVQPHLSRARYDAHVGLPCDASAADDTFRLRLLERLLHHARRDAINGVCEELVVIASAG
ncbi:hypothetical protein D5S18_16100 [Nocardia panacis]|uniref:Uncharacterized protein n=1 Tax=Nocardia panacis TaxID=2340916 RepID=A0A3A4KJ73_9NOCA|nr:hypothetical protein [Nocardia panacis]RJO74932.1 hypothetical protein D5S18_16100 [Nocardia panacis]